MGKVYETKFLKGTRIVHVRELGKVNGPQIEKVYVDEIAELPTDEQLKKLRDRRQDFLTK